MWFIQNHVDLLPVDDDQSNDSAASSDTEINKDDDEDNNERIASKKVPYTFSNYLQLHKKKYF